MPEDPRSELTTTEFNINKFLQRNIISADAQVNFQAWEGVRCIDGRHTEDYIEAVPGGHAGYLLAVLGAGRALLGDNYNHKVFLDTAVAYLTENGSKKLIFHTDAHAEHDHKGPGRGCGHLNKASQNPELYALTPNGEDSTLVFDLLGKLMAKDRAEQIVLEGEHKEKAVVIINSEHFGLRAQDRENHDMVFVFHQNVAERRLDGIAEALAGGDFGLQKEEFRQKLGEVFNQQLEATRRALAADKPIYKVVIDQDGQYQLLEAI